MGPRGEDAARVAAAATVDAQPQDALGRAFAIGGRRPQVEDIAIYGPAPAPMALLRGRYRYRLLLNAKRTANVQAVIRDWLGQFDVPRSVRINIDIDPYSFV